MGELARALNASGREIASSPVCQRQLAELVRLVDRGAISGAIAKDVFERMVRPAAPPKRSCDPRG